MPKGKFERTEEHKRRISEALKGRVKSAEECKRISEGKLRNPKRWSEEQRANFVAKMSGENNPNYGKSPSEETKQRLRAANAGKTKKLRRYGITDEQYSKELAAGNRWCFFRRHFAPIPEFSNKAGCCDSCRRDHYRKGDLARKYNLTHEQYEAMLASQGGGCAICGSSDPGPRNRHMMIDHDHATGRVRGILCSPCNTAVERMETVANWGLRAAQYLTSPKHQENGAAAVSPPVIGVAS